MQPETKLQEMLRLQAPPAGYMKDAKSVVTRLRAEGETNRRKRTEALGTVLFDPERPGHKRLKPRVVAPLPADRSAYLGD